VILKKLEETGRVLPWARISLHLGINPEIILSHAVHKGNRQLMKLLIELDAQQNMTLLALNSCSLRAQKYIICSFVYPKKLANRFLLNAKQ